jgi:hypothetical protein
MHGMLFVHVRRTDDVEQPPLLVPQVRTVPVPMQTVPLATLAHSGAAGAHWQEALPGEPLHVGFVAGQATGVEEVGQPSLLRPQVMMELPLQTVPLVRLPHSGAPGAQRQSATPPATLQGLPAGQARGVEAVTQPLAVVLQVTTALLAQTVPLLVPAQAGGAGLHWQEAVPAGPWQVSLGPQVRMAVTAGQPSPLAPQVMRVVLLVQRLPLVPMHAGGGASQEQEAEGRAPVQGLPVGQVLAGPL